MTDWNPFNGKWSKRDNYQLYMLRTIHVQVGFLCNKVEAVTFSPELPVWLGGGLLMIWAHFG